MEDKKISDAVNLLYKGAKMLSYHCPDCKVPLFQDGDRIFCPSCGRDAIFGDDTSQVEVKDEVKNETEKTEMKKEEDAVQTQQTQLEIKGNFNVVEESLKEAILKLSNELRKAKDIEEIKEIIDTIDKTTQILERLKKYR
jgi:UPF0148 protein